MTNAVPGVNETNVEAASDTAEPRVKVARYSVFTRINHWTLAATFVLLSLSGLALYHPMLYWLTGLFGGGANVRAWHPWIGVVLIVAWTIMFVRFWKPNLPEDSDWKWIKAIRSVLSADEDNVPEVGKYNPGQKFVFWSFALIVPALFLTGIAIWDQYFYDWTTIPQKRVAVLAHAMLAIAMIAVWITHFYAAFWVRGTLNAMTRGYVTGGWAWRHHRRWLRDLVAGRQGKEKPLPMERTRVSG